MGRHQEELPTGIWGLRAGTPFGGVREVIDVENRVLAGHLSGPQQNPGLQGLGGLRTWRDCWVHDPPPSWLLGDPSPKVLPPLRCCPVQTGPCYPGS